MIYVLYFVFLPLPRFHQHMFSESIDPFLLVRGEISVPDRLFRGGAGAEGDLAGRQATQTDVANRGMEGDVFGDDRPEGTGGGAGIAVGTAQDIAGEDVVRRLLQGVLGTGLDAGGEFAAPADHVEGRLLDQILDPAVVRMVGVGAGDRLRRQFPQRFEIN